jgi:hypothetical protein
MGPRSRLAQEWRQVGQPAGLGRHRSRELREDVGGDRLPGAVDPGVRGGPEGALVGVPRC